MDTTDFAATLQGLADRLLLRDMALLAGRLLLSLLFLHEGVTLAAHFGAAAAAMAALASLRAPIDAFFDSVIVNDPDPAKRSARLALLERIRAAVHNVADFSKIEG